jgi:hypothetical protein
VRLVPRFCLIAVAQPRLEFENKPILETGCQR